MTRRAGEHAHDDVYGKTFARYSPDELREFTNFFEQRFAANKLNPRELFEGKTVLDCGCGNGRGSLFAFQNGAAEISAVDFSATNIESTRRNLERAGAKIGTLHNGTLESIPFPDNSFDVVWCNGVLMHTAQPDKCLQEITRVLKPGGKAWIYVYGSGGVYWRFVETFREMTKDISEERCINLLELMRYENRFIAEYLDDWKVQHLRMYTVADFSRRLDEVGYDNTRPLSFGVSYDTSHRISTRPDEAKLWGEGDLRYLVTKARAPQAGGHPVSAGPRGSDYTYDPSIEKEFGALLQELQGAARDDVAVIAASAYVQWHLRAEMTRETGFDSARIIAVLKNAIALLKTP